MKTISINIEGEDAVINSALDSFVRQHGWSEMLSNGEPNQITAIQAARNVLASFITQSVAAWNGEVAARVARQEAAAQTEEALLGTQMKLTVS
jgi:hypothetical protein